ncbi:MAG: sulfur carrier protein ThiS [Clostridiales bacterium]|nr:sulfur carrier protein ThiS [Clostridiales bacterium]
MVVVNGKSLDVAGKTLKEYLEMANYNLRTIAVEWNEEIVTSDQYEKIVLKDGDVVEVVSFVGGG